MKKFTYKTKFLNDIFNVEEMAYLIDHHQLTSYWRLDLFCKS
jgi:hypothetical protein